MYFVTDDVLYFITADTLLLKMYVGTLQICLITAHDFLCLI